MECTKDIIGFFFQNISIFNNPCLNLLENSLTLRFNGNTIKEFDGPKFFWRKPGDYELNEDHKKILSDFFPRYIRVIYI